MDDTWSPWIGSVAGSLLVGLSGVFPLVLLPDPENDKESKNPGESPKLRLLLSFAVGGLLGDVFLHLLPEAWHLLRQSGNDTSEGHIRLGLWLLSGLFAFALLERLLTSTGGDADTDTDADTADRGHDSDTQNNNTDFLPAKKSLPKSSQGFSWTNPFKGVSSKRVTGYLNLLANGIDNFTHGLAVAGSFLVSTRVGLLTTFAILLHEIPHEVADFAILLRAGFGRWDAARAQLSTATVGLAGAITALGFNGAEVSEGRFTSWILPFTAGGFLHIALVTVLPELLEETRPKAAFLQAVCLFAGIIATASVSLLVE